MLKEVFASNAAKLVAACVCPVAAGTVALKVPPVRAALHKATAPKPEREARAKPRVRAPLPKAVAEREELSEAPLTAALMCPQPVMLGDAPIQPATFQIPKAIPIPTEMVRQDRIIVADTNCGPRMMGTMRFGVSAAVPEPATWAQMVAGFMLLGATVRAGRRRQMRAPA